MPACEENIHMCETCLYAFIFIPVGLSGCAGICEENVYMYSSSYLLDCLENDRVVVLVRANNYRIRKRSRNNFCRAAVVNFSIYFLGSGMFWGVPGFAFVCAHMDISAKH